MDQQTAGSAIVAKLVARPLREWKGVGEILGQGVQVDKGVGGGAPGKEGGMSALEKVMAVVTIDLQMEEKGGEGARELEKS